MMPGLGQFRTVLKLWRFVRGIAQKGRKLATKGAKKINPLDPKSRNTVAWQAFLGAFEGAVIEIFRPALIAALDQNGFHAAVEAFKEEVNQADLDKTAIEAVSGAITGATGTLNGNGAPIAIMFTEGVQNAFRSFLKDYVDGGAPLTLPPEKHIEAGLQSSVIGVLEYAITGVIDEMVGSPSLRTTLKMLSKALISDIVSEVLDFNTR